MNAVKVRQLEPSDLDFLHAMFVEPFSWREEGPRHSLQDIIAIPDLAMYVAGWGRPGDGGVVAVTDAGERLGAAWYRLFDEREHGYGFVSPEVPELGIAVRAENRGRRLGQRLMEGLIRLATDEGRPALSLSVEEDNGRAIRLYERVGFKSVKHAGNAWTMILALNPDGRSSAKTAPTRGPF